VSFNDWRLSPDAELTPQRGGLSTALSFIEEARITMIFMSVGLAQALQDLAVEYAKVRTQFGKPIGFLQLVQGCLRKYHRNRSCVDARLLGCFTGYGRRWQRRGDRRPSRRPGVDRRGCRGDHGRGRQGDRRRCRHDPENGDRPPVADCRTTFGSPDIVIANVNGPPPGFFDEVTDEQFEEAVRSMTMSLVYLLRQTLPHMKAMGWGRIINMNSIGAKAPPRFPGHTLVNTGRAAAVALAKSLSDEFAGFGITVNSIGTGFISTDRMLG
jgi:Enoyl-(Acyl carrier protein) reductase/Acyl-CoA dehydrogenase, C-terminal domain